MNRVARLLGAAGLCAAVVAIAAPAGAQIEWKSGVTPAARMSAVELTAALEALASRDSARRVVLEFDRPMTPERRAALADAGVNLLGYLSNDAFFASLDAALLDSRGVVAAGDLRGVREVERPWKLHPYLEADGVPTWAVVGVAGAEPGEDAAADPVFAVYAVLHADATLDEGRALAMERGAFVRSEVKSAHALVLEIAQSQVKALAESDAVMWVEPALPQWSELNAGNRWRTGADVVQAAPYSLNGAGVRVMIFDGGRIRDSHQDFGGRSTSGDASAVSSHGTHVAGTVGGNGAASGGQHRGMAPGVTLFGYGFQWAGGNQFLYGDPGDMEADYTNAFVTRGAVIANNSIGNNTSTNGHPCEWMGDYGTTDILIDNMARGSLGPLARIVFAAGNERQSTRCQGANGGYRTTTVPANAKNHITVGALNSNDDSVASFTSWGPSDDGRLKPDISAPGCQSGPDVIGPDDDIRSVTSSSDTAYSNLCGTSMAAPTVTGLLSLVIQDWRVQHPSLGDPWPSTLKSLLAHTAQDIQNPGPDYQTGYGSVRVQPAVDIVRAGNFVQNEVGQGDAYTVLVPVAAGAPTFKVTIAWDDPAATPNVNPVLVNNLDLVVFDPNGNRVFPWTLNPAAPSQPAVQTQADSLNNIEQVFAANPTPGLWRVEVRGTSVPVGPQRFSLWATPELVNCSTDGVAALDKAFYVCDSSAVLSVTDCDLDLDPNAVETVQVTVSSTSEPAGLPLVLTETGPATARFTGTIMLRSVPSGAGLLAVDGDTVTITYIDAQSTGGPNVVRTDTAVMDCVAPGINNVQATNVTAGTATITFATSEPAAGAVSVGTSCGSLPTTVSGQGGLTSHAINLAGLTPNTEYRFTVAAGDQAGNSATANNGGACFTFRTAPIPIAELFSTTDPNDLDNRSITYTPTGPNAYNACGDSPISALPTDPAGGTALALLATGNPAFQQVTLTGGAQVPLYGVNYSSFFVGRHGYITFTTGDTNGAESVASHFSQPRVSGHFDNVLTSAAPTGTVSWKQLADRVAVTWTNIANNEGPATFQIELFFDGRVRTSFLSIAAADGLSGISPGGGTPAGFVETNLSALSVCLTPCVGDVNGDRIVDFADLNVILTNFGQTGAGLPGDLNGDGIVDFADLNTVLTNFGLVC